MSAGTGVSVVIPFHNGTADHLADTLRSVAAQTRPPDEVVIVDDGSKPGPAAALTQVATRFGAKVYRQPNRGPAAARNLGAARATGRWLAFLDADDLWHPEKLERQLWVAQQRGNEGKLILTRTETRRHDRATHSINRFDGLGGREAFIDRILGAGPTHSFTSALFLSAAGFNTIGGFPEHLRFREDHFFLLRAVRILGWVGLPEVLSIRLMHPTSTTTLGRNATAAAQFERQRRFADAVERVELGFDRRKFLAREAIRIGKRMLRERRSTEALAMAAAALRHGPDNRRSWLLAPAALASLVARPVLGAGPARRGGMV